MWKKAVCHWDPQTEVAPGDLRRTRFALTLLEDLHRSYTGREEDLLNQLYNQLTVAHGIYKTTRRGRFAEFDQLVAADVLRRYPGVATLKMHDLAASSGISSLELFQAIRAHRPVELHFSDLYDRLKVVRVPDSRWDVVFDSTGNALEYVGHGFALSASKGESRRHPINQLLKRMLDRSLLPRADRLLDASENANADPAGENVREVMLLHPECLRAITEHEDFRFFRHDLFAPLEGEYHVLRAMNIFNPGYFGDEQILAGVRASAHGLVEGGVFLIGRSVEERDGQPRATAFVRSKNRLFAAWDLNGGAENKTSIDGMPLVEQIVE